MGCALKIVYGAHNLLRAGDSWQHRPKSAKWSNGQGFSPRHQQSSGHNGRKGGSALRERPRQLRQAHVVAVLDVHVAVVELLVLVGDAQILQPPSEQPCTVVE